MIAGYKVEYGHGAWDGYWASRLFDNKEDAIAYAKKWQGFHNVVQVWELVGYKDSKGNARTEYKEVSINVP